MWPRLLTVAVVLFALSSCSLLEPAADKLGEGADKYCSETAPLVREQIRQSINPTPAGNCVAAWCKTEGDTEPVWSDFCQ